MERIPLGNPAPDGALRDAVCIAIIPVTCSAAVIHPGQRILVDRDLWAYPAGHGVPNAIADPWFHTAEHSLIHPNTRFYALMDPSTITGLRHHWDHPDIPAERTPRHIVREVLDELNERLTAMVEAQAPTPTDPTPEDMDRWAAGRVPGES